MSEHADYRDEAEDYAARAPAEPATGDDITGAEGALVISIPEAKYPAGKTATAQDADLTAGNIKKDVELFGVMGTFEGAAGLTIKSIQSVTGTIANGDTDEYVTIDEVDMDNTVLIFLGCRSATGTLYDRLAMVLLNGSTEVRILRYGTTGNVVASFMVVEFDGGVKPVQRGLTSLDTTELTDTVTIDEVDLAKTILFRGGFEVNNSDLSSALFTLELEDSTTLRVTRTAKVGYAWSTWQILEFE